MIDGGIVPERAISLTEELAGQLDSYRLYEGDIVMARRGEVGRVALVTNKEEGWLCGTGSFVLRFHGEISRSFIRMLFACDSIRAYLAGSAVGTTMVNLNHGILLKMPIGIPPPTEQHRIVAKVDELMALCDQLASQLKSAREVSGRYASAATAAALKAA